MFFLAQLDGGVTVAFVTLAITVVGTGVAVGFRLGKTEERISVEVANLRAWITDLAAGKGPICAQHGEQIVSLQKQVNRHEDLLNPSMPRPACEGD